MTSIRTGTLLYGYCDGWFGRDSYETKRVEAFGADWVVAREIKTGIPIFASRSPEQLAEFATEKERQRWEV